MNASSQAKCMLRTLIVVEYKETLRLEKKKKERKDDLECYSVTIEMEGHWETLSGADILRLSNIHLKLRKPT